MDEVDLFSPIHLVVLLAVALLIFGPKRLPEIGSGLGKTIRAFKASVNGEEANLELPNPTSSGKASGQAVHAEEPNTRSEK